MNTLKIQQLKLIKQLEKAIQNPQESGILLDKITNLEKRIKDGKNKK